MTRVFPPILGLGMAGLLTGLSCQATPHADLPDPDLDLGLGNIVLLTFTTRSPDGLLGHVLEAGAEPGGNLDPHCKPIAGGGHLVPNSQHLRLVMRVEDEAALGAGYGPAHAEAKATRASHVAYDVTVSGYLEYAPFELEYDARSGCCVGGATSPTCGSYYVTRLLRGTGKTQLLSEVAGSGSLRAGDVLRASGGRSFRKLSESEFEDSYFAYEFATLEPLCRRVEPDKELAPLKVEAAKNCFLTVYAPNGTREQFTWSLPDRELCQVVLQRACNETHDIIRCEGRHRRTTPQSTLSLLKQALRNVIEVLRRNAAAPEGERRAASAQGEPLDALPLEPLEVVPLQQPGPAPHP